MHIARVYGYGVVGCSIESSQKVVQRGWWYLSAILKDEWASTPVFDISTLRKFPKAKNWSESDDYWSTIILLGNPVFTKHRRSGSIHQMWLVEIFGKNWAAENCIWLSTTCNTGAPSRYMILMKIRSLNTTSSKSRETQNRVWPLWILWQEPHVPDILSSVCLVEKLAFYGCTRRMRLQSLCVEVKNLLV